MTGLRDDAGPRTAKVRFPFGGQVDSVLTIMEGAKRRLKDGRVSFQASPMNLALVQRYFPDAPVELPFDYSQPVGEDEPCGLYAGPARLPLYEFQRQAIEAAGLQPFFAFFMEMGTGKTRCAIEKAGRHYAAGHITGVLIVTFKGVHRQWIETQVPTHLGTIDGEPIDCRAEFWDGKKAPSWGQKYRNRLEIFAATFPSLTSKNGEKAVEEFTIRHQGRLMAIIDESHAIKTPHSARSEACIAIGHRARIRLILTGTPVPAKIEDEWSQSLFLSEVIFGSRYVTTFRAAYTDSDGNPRNLPAFQEKIAPYCYRVTKDEALDLPPKIYDQYKFDLLPNARRVYNELKRNFLTETDSGETVTVQNAAVLALRLQQITCGVLVDEKDADGSPGDVHRVGTEREDALGELLTKFAEERKIIVWCRFTRDVDAAVRVCTATNQGRVVTLDGRSKDAERRTIEADFMRDDNVKFLVAMPAVAGTGYNFQGACRTAIYYSNSFNSVERWQSEDRIHRIGTTHPVQYIDIVCKNSVDEGILANLKAKTNFATLVMDLIKREISK